MENDRFVDDLTIKHLNMEIFNKSQLSYGFPMVYQRVIPPTGPKLGMLRLRIQHFGTALWSCRSAPSLSNKATHHIGIYMYVCIHMYIYISTPLDQIKYQ